MSILEILAMVLVLFGMFFLLLGALGLLRFPDFYTRMHAAGKCDTLGALLVTVGLAVAHGVEYHGSHQGAFKLVVIAVFIFFTSPTATHAIGRAAVLNQLPMWTRKNPKEDAS